MKPETDRPLPLPVFAGYETESVLDPEPPNPVYRCRNTATGRVDAVKIVGVKESAQATFLHRATLVKRLYHPALVGLSGIHQDEERTYLTMPLLDKFSLEALLVKNGKLPAPLVFLILRQTVQALQYVSACSLSGLGLTPRRVLLDGSARVSLLVHGLLESNADKRAFRPVTYGPICYLSPEETLEAGGDARSDIYSLGTIAYHAIVGRPPFVGDNYYESKMRKFTEAPAWPDDARRLLPSIFQRTVQRMLALKPTDRQADLRELEAELFEIEKWSRSRRAEIAAPPAAREEPTPAPVESAEPPPAAVPQAARIVEPVPPAPGGPLLEEFATPAPVAGPEPFPEEKEEGARALFECFSRVEEGLPREPEPKAAPARAPVERAASRLEALRQNVQRLADSPGVARLRRFQRLLWVAAAAALVFLASFSLMRPSPNEATPAVPKAPPSAPATPKVERARVQPAPAAKPSVPTPKPPEPVARQPEPAPAVPAEPSPDSLEEARFEQVFAQVEAHPDDLSENLKALEAFRASAQSRPLQLKAGMRVEEARARLAQAREQAVAAADRQAQALALESRWGQALEAWKLPEKLVDAALKARTQDAAAKLRAAADKEYNRVAADAVSLCKSHNYEGAEERYRRVVERFGLPEPVATAQEAIKNIRKLSEEYRARQEDERRRRHETLFEGAMRSACQNAAAFNYEAAERDCAMYFKQSASDPDEDNRRERIQTLQETIALERQTIRGLMRKLEGKTLGIARNQNPRFEQLLEAQVKALRNGDFALMEKTDVDQVLKAYQEALRKENVKIFFIEGTVAETNDKFLSLRLSGESGLLCDQWQDLPATELYLLFLRVADLKDPQTRLGLGLFLFNRKLPSFAAGEFEAAVKLDPALREKAELYKRLRSLVPPE